MMRSTQSRVAFAPVRLQLHNLQHEIMAGCSQEANANVADSSLLFHHRFDCELGRRTPTF